MGNMAQKITDADALYALFARLNKQFLAAQGNTPEGGCSCVTTDSRNCPQGSMFFALKGENFNGNAYAAKALEQGAVCAVVDEPQYAVDERFVLVDNVLRALQQLARMHRVYLGKPVIGITGTNGKTTTKELLAAVLKQKYRVHYTQGNLNNHIGVPLTLLKMQPEDEIGIIEMGASHPGDIQELVEIACPNAGLITNVGKAHLLGFGSFEGVKKTKGELYDYIRSTGGFIFRNVDNPDLAEMAGDLPTYGYSLKPQGAPVWGQVTACETFLEMDIHAAEETFRVKTNLIGAYNAENVLVAVTVGTVFGLTAGQIRAGIETYVPQNNRSMLKKTERNTVVVDAYNANPTSMRAALLNFAQMRVPHRTLILGDMLELGEQSETEHRAIVELLESCGFEQVFLVGSQFCSIQPPFPHFDTVASLRAYLTEHPITGSHILLKGSRGIKLEEVLEVL